MELRPVMVDLFMKDGRTIFRFASRGLAVKLMKRNPLELGDDENRSLRCWAKWERGSDWMPARLQLVNPSSIACVVQVPPEQRDAFLAQHDKREQVEAAA